MKTKFILAIALIFTAISLNANNLRISGGTRVDNDKVTFTVAWDNSWSVTGAPSNHDAVWVFIKYRECNTFGDYTHALFNLTNIAGSDFGGHTFGADLTLATDIALEDRFGVVPGGADKFNGLGNNTGIMLKRAVIGKGNIAPVTCTVQLTNNAGVAFDPGKTYEIRVIGIEMVYVNESPFYVGDNVPEWGPSNYEFNWRHIVSEGAISAGYLFGDAGGNAALPAEFPKGYNSFYCMKYEITQGQYNIFRETTPIIPSDNVTSNNGRNRNNTLNQATPDRAQNYLTWPLLRAYLDWSCLRPMTEMEYEKACIGPLDQQEAQCYAWGTTGIIVARYISGVEDGTETVATTNANCHYSYYEGPYLNPNYPEGSLNLVWGGWRNPSYNYTTISSPECEAYPVPFYTNVGNQYSYYVNPPIRRCGVFNGQGFGPLGVGIFARDNTLTRETTGATYYGIMEMSGNVFEQCVNVGAHGASYDGQWGNGYLTPGGVSDVPNWPADYRCLRGGSYGSIVNDVNALKVCFRYSSYWDTNTNDPDTNGAREGSLGGRGVR